MPANSHDGYPHVWSSVHKTGPMQMGNAFHLQKCWTAAPLKSHMLAKDTVPFEDVEWCTCTQYDAYSHLQTATIVPVAFEDVGMFSPTSWLPPDADSSWMTLQGVLEAIRKQDVSIVIVFMMRVQCITTSIPSCGLGSRVSGHTSQV